MAAPTDATPLALAVVRAITTFTGQPRALPATRLYRMGRPGDLLEGPAPGDVFGRPRAFLVPPVVQEIDPQLQMTDRMRVEVTLELRCWYHVGDGVGTAEWDRAMERIAADVVSVAQALSYPGALELDPEGRETGLDGGSLRTDAGRHVVRGPVPLPGERFAGQVYQVTHVWRATAELTRASA